MSFVIVRQKTEDYPKWKEVFDATASLRKASGEKSCRIFRCANDLNEVLVLSEWGDLLNAVKYSQNAAFKEATQKAGVLTKPIVYMPEDGLGA